MLVRLAFSIAIRAEGDIFILDEVLSVGDVKFQDKSKQEIFKLKEMGKTILFVSHSMESVKTFCTRAICIDNGSIVEKKDIDSTIDFYLKSLN